MIIGIDLGTTHSLVAVWRNGRAELLPNALGEVLTPSCVSLDEDGTVLVGRAARERAQTHPERTARAFKRYMGSNKVLRLGNRDFRPEELSALVLKSLKADAEAALGESVTEAIISVPAYFSDAQRKATRLAGELAGLKVERLVNEPTAAALACGIHLLGAETCFLVFDLGGGTFDVSILEIFEGVMEVRASAGDNFLGGEDFNDCLINLFFERHALSPNLRRDDMFMQRLNAQAESAKRELSTKSTALMSVYERETQYELAITEELFATACAPLLKRLRTPVERAMRDANLRSSDLDNIVLAGGTTRMPIVRRLVTSMFGRFPAVDFNPDEVVALGAAVQAGLKAKDAALNEVVMTDVAPYSLGVEVRKQVSSTVHLSGYFDPVIERNTSVPVSRVKNYSISQSAASVDLSIYQGESRMVKDNIHLGNLKIALPPLLNGANFEVRFTYDVNGLLEVEALVVETGEKFALIIEGSPGALTAQQIQDCLKALEQIKIHPRDSLENRTTLARTERIYQLLRGDMREWLANEVLVFDAALASQDPHRIIPARQQLEKALDAIENHGLLNSESDTELF